MNRSFKIWFGVLIFLLAIGCKKDEPVKSDVKLIGQESLNWVFYKSGSYWIYQDSISSMYDTLVIKEHFFDTTYAYPPDSQLPYPNTRFQSVRSYYDTNNYYSLSEEGVTAGGAFTKLLLDCSRHIIFDNEHLIIGVETNIHNLENEIISSTTYLEYFDLLIVNGKAYNSVRKILVKDHLIGLNFEYYLARNNGIIMLREKGDTLHRVWKLIDSNIIQ
ncbi:MAG: hypothetical protein V2I47_03245 [Bacteroidales bacterium]|jgi:hypothetical protein|nr:hypothetical protein [Bacteroidales bacterium]